MLQQIEISRLDLRFEGHRLNNYFTLSSFILYFLCITKEVKKIIFRSKSILTMFSEYLEYFKWKRLALSQ